MTDALPGNGFGRFALPYGSFSAGGTPHAAVAVDGAVLDLTVHGAALLPPEAAGLFAGGTLDRFLAAGREAWDDVRARLLDAFSGTGFDHLLGPPGDGMRLPFAVADYADFYSNEQHATNAGQIFRPGGEALHPNWRHLPVGYHGRAGTVVVSGTPVVRPSGQRRAADGGIVFGATERLDVEVELGFVVGTPSAPGESVPLAAFEDHVLGVVPLNDWSARDIQAWETAPLGPFLGKSFATSISPWVVPLAALAAARVQPPPRDPRPLPYLDDAGAPPWGLDLTFELRLGGHVVSRPPFAGMYWTGAQQLAHLTVNGASLRTGDLYGSGTVSGAERDERGSLLELSWNGAEPVELPGGGTRSYLEDGDEVVISATAPGPDGSTVPLGEVRGTVLPAR